MTQQQKEWYKKWWGIVLAVLLLPFFIVWYAWNKSNWNVAIKLGATAFAVFLGLFILGTAVGTPPEHQKTEQAAQNTSAQTQEQPKQEVKLQAPQYTFDVPALVGKNIDQLRQVLGQPTDSSPEPTAEQMQYTSLWDNTFKKDGKELLATYDARTREVEDLFISTDDPSGQTQDKAQTTRTW
jgi:hypothetical protein